VEKEIKNADKTDLAPWRPKVFRASDFTLKCAAGAYGAILLFNFLLRAQPQGVEATVMAGVVLNCWKQYQIFPADQFGELQKRLETGWRNLFRYALRRCVEAALAHSSKRPPLVDAGVLDIRVRCQALLASLHQPITLFYL
jgi:hypothetical protein